MKQECEQDDTKRTNSLTESYSNNQKLHQEYSSALLVDLFLWGVLNCVSVRCAAQRAEIIVRGNAKAVERRGVDRWWRDGGGTPYRILRRSYAILCSRYVCARAHQHEREFVVSWSK